MLRCGLVLIVPYLCVFIRGWRFGWKANVLAGLH